MSVAQKQRRCGECGRKTLHARERFSGGVGCILTIVTAGLFLPVWLLIDAVGLFKPWRCQICGKAN